jgi:hypothetical protein
MTGEERFEVSPYEHPASRSTFQPLVPDPLNLIAILLDPPNVSRDAIVGIVTIEDRRQPGSLIACRPMPVGPAPFVDRGQRAGEAAFGRCSPHHVLAFPRLLPRVGEAEEVERLGLAVCGRPTMTLRAEVDEARLVRMQFEAEPTKPLPGRRGGYPPRPPQIRTRRFPASGSSRERFVPASVAVGDPGCWQCVAVEERVEAFPCERLSARSTGEPLVPDLRDLVAIIL